MDGHRTPEELRELVRGYVRELHATYLDHVRHLPPAERAALPLVAAEQLTVVAAAGRRLHLIATTERLPAPQGQEVELLDEHDGTRWAVRFYDPSVLPGLGLLPEDTPLAVRQVLGIADPAYHLTVDVGGALGGHQAQHSAVALANLHSRTNRDLDRVRTALPRQAAVVDELSVCVRLGLDHVTALLVAELTAGRVVPGPDTPAADGLAALLADLGR
jgi:hypothetical protein